MADKIIEIQDIINIRDLPRDLRPGDLFVLSYDWVKDWKLVFAFKNIGTPLEEFPDL